jgi:hypothetical protein
MGATFNTGYLENLILYNGSNNIGIGTSADATYKVTLGGSLLGTSALFSSSLTATQGNFSGSRPQGIFTENGTSGLYLRDATGSSYKSWSIGTNDIVVGFAITPSTAAGGTTFTTPAFLINESGNVLIGGTVVQNSAANRGNLTINGTTSILNLSTSGTNAGYLYHNATDMLLVNAKNGATLFYTNDTERMRITSGGAVVIGSATYGSSLGQLRIINDASSTPASMSLFGYNNVADNTTYAKIDFAMQTSGTGGNILATINGVSSGTDENSSHLTFSTATTGTLSERMRITSGGNVGIGTSSPAAADFSKQSLDVSGPIIARGSLYDHQTSATVMQYYNGESWIRAYGATAGSGILVFRTGGGGGSGDTERMRITSGGNVLMNSTATTTTGGFTNSTLLVKQIADGNDGGGIQIEQNSTDNVAFFGFSGSVFRIGLSYRSAGSYQPMAFSTGGTERMRITSGGNVLIGTTNNNGKLVIQDSVYGEYFRIASGVIGGNQTSVYLAWNNGGNITLQQVVVGAADSGGSGFRLLRIPNT